MSDEEQQVSGVNWGWFAIFASIIAIVGGTTYFLLPLATENKLSLIHISEPTRPY